MYAKKRYISFYHLFVTGIPETQEGGAAYEIAAPVQRMRLRRIAARAKAYAAVPHSRASSPRRRYDVVKRMYLTHK